MLGGHPSSDSFDEIDRMLEEQEQKHMPTKPSEPTYGEYKNYERPFADGHQPYKNAPKPETEYGVRPHFEYDD
jgi:hypothetical protein